MAARLEGAPSMNENNTHPLTEARAAELWDDADSRFPWSSLYSGEKSSMTAAMQAAHDAGREHERTTTPDPHHDPRPWQDCTREDIRKGDLVEVQCGEITRTGIAHHQDAGGDWRTKGGTGLTLGNLWSLRRIPAPTPPAVEVELPDEFGAVITDVEDNNGLTYHRMVFDGACYARYDRSRLPEDVRAFTLPDGTRARRDGEREDGTPRFVKAQEGEK